MIEYRESLSFNKQNSAESLLVLETKYRSNLVDLQLSSILQYQFLYKGSREPIFLNTLTLKLIYCYETNNCIEIWQAVLNCFEACEEDLYLSNMDEALKMLLNCMTPLSKKIITIKILTILSPFLQNLLDFQKIFLELFKQHDFLLVEKRIFNCINKMTQTQRFSKLINNEIIEKLNNLKIDKLVSRSLKQCFKLVSDNDSGSAQQVIDICDCILSDKYEAKVALECLKLKTKLMNINLQDIAKNPNPSMCDEVEIFLHRIALYSKDRKKVDIDLIKKVVDIGVENKNQKTRLKLLVVLRMILVKTETCNIDMNLRSKIIERMMEFANQKTNSKYMFVPFTDIYLFLNKKNSKVDPETSLFTIKLCIDMLFNIDKSQKEKVVFKRIFYAISYLNEINDPIIHKQINLGLHSRLSEMKLSQFKRYPYLLSNLSKLCKFKIFKSSFLHFIENSNKVFYSTNRTQLLRYS